MINETEILLTDSDHIDFQKLSADLENELFVLDGAMAEANKKLNAVGYLPNVFIAFVNDVAVACGAFRQYNSNTAEIKRMFVAEAFRRKGIATEILDAIESIAKELKYKTCLLETGKNQPAAISFYTKHGYKQTANFGRYTNNENSICFSKRI